MGVYIVFSCMIKVDMDLEGIWCESVNWINFLVDMEWWWALVNAVMNLQVIRGREFFD
jgi:hypothetical protein